MITTSTAHRTLGSFAASSFGQTVEASGVLSVADGETFELFAAAIAAKPIRFVVHIEDTEPGEQPGFTVDAPEGGSGAKIIIKSPASSVEGGILRPAPIAEFEGIVFSITMTVHRFVGYKLVQYTWYSQRSDNKLRGEQSGVES